MTSSPYSYSPAPPPPPGPRAGRSSAAVTSFILGILGCLPFITGLLAVILGIVGIRATAPGQKRGRWMAVTGLILGIVSILAWCGASAFGAAAYALYKITIPERIAAHDFIHDVATGDDAAAKDLAVDMSDASYDHIATEIRGFGTFDDTTFLSMQVINNSATAEGIATFTSPAGGSAKQVLHVHAELQEIDGKWKVHDMTVSR